MTIDIAALRALVEAATPLPWIFREDEPLVLFSANRGGFDLTRCPDPVANAALIVAAVNALPALLAEVERLREANKWLEAMREHIVPTLRAKVEALQANANSLRDVLLRNGFVRCDIPACNCGSWHARYGYPERFNELREALAEAGHPTCNENGNLVSGALRGLIAELNALRAAKEQTP